MPCTVVKVPLAQSWPKQDHRLRTVTRHKARGSWGTKASITQRRGWWLQAQLEQGAGVCSSGQILPHFHPRPPAANREPRGRPGPCRGSGAQPSTTHPPPPRAGPSSLGPQRAPPLEPLSVTRPHRCHSRSAKLASGHSSTLTGDYKPHRDQLPCCTSSIREVFWRLSLPDGRRGTCTMEPEDPGSGCGSHTRECPLSGREVRRNPHGL